MKKYLASIAIMGFILSPAFAFADISFTPDLKTIGCYDVTSGAVTITGSAVQVAFSNDGHIDDFSLWNISGSADLSDGGSLPYTYPITVNTYNYYDGGWSYDHSITPLTLQETACSGGGDPDPTATSTATSTIAVGGIEFGLAIIITFMSLAFIGFISNRILEKRKKRWQK